MFNKLTEKAMTLADVLLACVQKFKMAVLVAVMIVAGFLMLAPAHATLGLSISSTTVPGPNTTIPFIFLARRNETVAYIANSTAPLNPGTTIQLEQSTNFSNWTIVVASACGPGPLGTVGVVGNTPPFFQDTYLRWNIISTNAVPIPLTLTIRDNDDNVSTLKNNKGQDAVYFNDDSASILGAMKPDRLQWQTATSSPIIISSYSQFGFGPVQTADKVSGWLSAFSTNTIQLDRSFVVIQATGTVAQDGQGKNGFLLSATPTISTQTAVNGDVVMFTSNTSSITFTDNSIIPGTALRLGATSRPLGVGDFLGLIFKDGFWREFMFVNNLE